MKERKKSTVSRWIRTLRENCGESQQMFSTRLGISMSSLLNYEYERLHIGIPKIWLAFLREAKRQESELTPGFREGFAESLNTDAAELQSLLRDGE